MNKLLFLDIDGVCNKHEYDPLAESNNIDPVCVANLNRVLDATGCNIVLSSAWRYMILNGAMSLKGFEYLLRTHRVRCKDRLIGCLDKDFTQHPSAKERGPLIEKWLDEHGPSECRYAIVDDLDLGFDGMPFVQTDAKTGLTEKDADRLISLLRGKWV